MLTCKQTAVLGAAICLFLTMNQGLQAFASSLSKSSQCPGKNDTSPRLSCGGAWRWQTRDACLAEGCCMDPIFPNTSSADQHHVEPGPADLSSTHTIFNRCYYPPPSSGHHPHISHITDVHVVQGCHLDVGFADTADKIVDRWFTEFFPAAAKTGEQLENNSTTLARLKFTAQSWLISLYFNCPSNLGITCPSEEDKAMVRKAIEKGYITWHAFPFNAQLEMYNPTLIDFGLNLTHQLDDMFGVNRKTVLSQRDVPGTTRTIIPLLKRRGVRTVSVGTNGGSTPPDVPRAFSWRDPQSGERVLALYVTGGYGGLDLIPHIYVPTLLPNSSHAMVILWRGDNSGPAGVDELVSNFADIQRLFPKANVFASTFDNFTNTVIDRFGVLDMLPEITSEIGDTWIHGVASDPRKMAKHRIMQHCLEECIADGDCSLDPAVDKGGDLFNFTRLLLKNGEHTWGLDVKSTLNDQRENWSNAEFSKVRSRSDYIRLETSWARQAAWGLDIPFQSLRHEKLRNMINESLVELTNTNWPVPPGSRVVHRDELNKPVIVGKHAIQFDPVAAGIRSWSYGGKNIFDVGEDSDPLYALAYFTYSEGNYTDFLLRYNYAGRFFPLDDYDDFGKVGIGKANATYRKVFSKASTLYVSPPFHCRLGMLTNNLCISLILQSNFSSDLVQNAGAPETAFVNVTFWDPLLSSMGLSVKMYNKTATRLPEALLFTVYGGYWQELKVHKVDANASVDVQDIVRGGSKHMHVSSYDGGMVIRSTFADDVAYVGTSSPTTGLVCTDNYNVFPTPLTKTTDMNPVTPAFVLFNNIWNTNYIMWSEGDFAHHFFQYGTG